MTQSQIIAQEQEQLQRRIANHIRNAGSISDETRREFEAHTEQVIASRIANQSTWEARLRRQKAEAKAAKAMANARLLEKINSTDHDNLRFRDFRDLKCGRDKYSSLRGLDLYMYIGDADREALLASDLDPSSRDAAARWVLRGLEVSRAIRKITVDLEVGVSAVNGPRPKWGRKGRDYLREDADYHAGKYNEDWGKY